MKKLLTLLAVAVFAVNTSPVKAQTVQSHTKVTTTAKTSTTSVHTSTDATPDVQVSVKTHTNTPRRRYNKHRSTRVSSTTHVKPDGSANAVQHQTTTTTTKSKM